MKKSFRIALPLLLAAALWHGPAIAAAQDTVAETISGIVDRLQANLSEEQLSAIDAETLGKYVTDKDRHVLGTQYWTFDVNVPVVVSVIRHTEQAVTPFWLEKRGFTKTDMVVKNMEDWEYEVWQKAFPAGRVELGINGFDKHRPHYFVSVGPQQKGADLEVTDIQPETTIVEMRKGAFTYHDWTELVLTDVPEELQGQKLLQTIRGRAREAHILGAFRKTPHPSSTDPDQIILTWSGDPSTTQTVQWRTSTEVEGGVVRYREKGAPEDKEVEAELFEFEDLMLANDRRMHHFTAEMTGLQPATTYLYRVGSPGQDAWSDEYAFTTAPAADDAAFSFIQMSDTHKNEDWGAMLEVADSRHEDVDFYVISGDLVSTGLYRDDWDVFLQLGTPEFSERPVIPAIGNHDDQDGLGAWMYLETFALPEEGPDKEEPERTYSVRYGNTLFLVLDIGTSVDDQVAWLENELKNSDATWKIAMVHFPPYAYDDDYPEMRAKWGALFDEYGVDLVLSGHVHYYMRSKPIRDQKPVQEGEDGTVYLITVSVPSRDGTANLPEYAEKLYGGGPLYQKFDIEGDRLVSRSYDAEGNVRDEFVLEK